MNSKKNKPAKIRVDIYSKADCHLCDVAKATLLGVQQTIPFQLHEIDITDDRNLFEQYKEQIPVVFINGKKAFKFRVDDGELRKKLKRIG